MIRIEVIPYKTFKERLRIVKEYKDKAKITIYKDYVYCEFWNYCEVNFEKVWKGEFKNVRRYI